MKFLYKKFILGVLAAWFILVFLNSIAKYIFLSSALETLRLLGILRFNAGGLTATGVWIAAMLAAAFIVCVINEKLDNEYPLIIGFLLGILHGLLYVTGHFSFYFPSNLVLLILMSGIVYPVDSYGRIALLKGSLPCFYW